MSRTRLIGILAVVSFLGAFAVVSTWRDRSAELGPDAMLPRSEDLGQIEVKALQEISGIATSRLSPDIVFVHNDGDRALVFALTATGRLVQRYKLSKRVHDAEDIAMGPGPGGGEAHLYLGDIGDNERRRKSIAVLHCPESSLSQPLSQPSKKKSLEINMGRIELRYPDGAHDAEALLIDPIRQDVVIVTKDDNGAQVYAAPLQANSAGQLQKLADLNVAKVSGGDISSDGKWIVLRSEEIGWLWRRSPEESLVEAFSRSPQLIDVHRDSQSENGEAIAILADGSGYVTVGEGENETIARFPLPIDSGSSQPAAQPQLNGLHIDPAP